MAFQAPRVTGHDINDFLFNITGAGNVSVIALVTGKTIRVMSYAFVVDGATTVTWKANTIPVTGAMPFAINGGISVPFSPAGWFQTGEGGPLTMSLGTTTVTVSGHGTYITFT